jgi:hypothetical protein
MRVLALACLLMPLLTTLALSNELLIDTEGKWRLESSSSGISTYTLLEITNGIIPLKTDMLVPYSIEKVIAALDDNDRRHQYAQNFKSSHLLEKVSLYEKFFYTRVEFPLWFEDRTVNIHVKVKISDDLNTVTIYENSAVHSKSKQYNTHTRANIYDSSIKLER